MTARRLTLFLTSSLVFFQLWTPSAHAQDQTASEQVLISYSLIADTLSNDQMTGVKEAAALLIEASQRLQDRKLATELRKSSKSLVDASPSSDLTSDLKKARDHFKNLSSPLVKWVKRNKSVGWSVLYCPMVGASWLQRRGEPVRNPYFGEEMLSCGEKVS
ncbi:MAG: DUF3347 domain-containing protein [Methylotenera sp.]|nr:DUF3347 domain-containing protein [Oligoflexia bacterium]